MLHFSFPFPLPHEDILNSQFQQPSFWNLRPLRRWRFRSWSSRFICWRWRQSVPPKRCLMHLTLQCV